jgi:hypothetical protein
MDFTVETPLKTRVDRGILDLIAPTAPSTGFAHSGAPLTGPPLTGPPVTGDRDDGEALPPGFKELIAWTRGDGGSVSILGHDDKDDAPDISPICDYKDDCPTICPDTSPGYDDDDEDLPATEENNSRLVSKEKSASRPSKTSGGDPSSAIEIDSNDDDEPRPTDRRPALVVCRLQGTPRRIFQEAFDGMLNYIADTPSLLEVNIAGANMDKKDALSLVSPR